MRSAGASKERDSAYPVIPKVHTAVGIFCGIIPGRKIPVFATAQHYTSLTSSATAVGPLRDDGGVCRLRGDREKASQDELREHSVGDGG